MFLFLSSYDSRVNYEGEEPKSNRVTHECLDQSVALRSLIGAVFVPFSIKGIVFLGMVLLPF